MELGYDCLAVLQTTGYIERKFGILLDGDLLEHADTPRRYLGLVNAELHRVFNGLFWGLAQVP